MEKAEINFLDIEENKEYIKIVNKVISECFKEENMEETNLYINVVLTNPENIKKMNKKYRNIDKETDVLSFPMYEKEDLKNITNTTLDILGDIVISIDKIERQALEYEHSFKRELSYMLIHGFYHLMGYDHIKEDDKLQMRQKEKALLKIIYGG